MQIQIFVALALALGWAGLASATPLTDVDLGSAPYGAGSASVSNGVYTLSGAAGGPFQSGTADNQNFDYVKLTGYGSITAQVAAANNTFTFAGLMARTSLDASATMLEVLTLPQQQYICRASERVAAGSASYSNNCSSYLPWMRIVWNSSGMTAYQSGNGSTWVSAGTMAWGAGTPAYLGLTEGNYGSYWGTATFQNVTLTSTATGNTGASTGVPEPLAAGLLGLGMLGTGLLQRRRAEARSRRPA